MGAQELAPRDICGTLVPAVESDTLEDTSVARRFAEKKDLFQGLLDRVKGHPELACFQWTLERKLQQLVKAHHQVAGGQEKQNAQGADGRQQLQ